MAKKGGRYGDYGYLCTPLILNVGGQQQVQSLRDLVKLITNTLTGISLHCLAAVVYNASLSILSLVNRYIYDFEWISDTTRIKKRILSGGRIFVDFRHLPFPCTNIIALSLSFSRLERGRRGLVACSRWSEDRNNGVATRSSMCSRRLAKQGESIEGSGAPWSS